MFKFGSSSEDERSYVIFDVGADSVGVGVGISGSKGERLLWHKRFGYAFQDATDYVRYERSMYATLLEVGMSLMSEGFRIAQQNSSFDARHLKVVCVLAAPWFLGTVGTEVRKKEKEFEVTQTVLDEMRSAMFSEFLASPESKSWKEVMGMPQLIEQFETDVRFDGYQVSVYKGRHTTELTLHSYLAVVSQHVVEQVQDIVHRILPNQNLLITSSTRALTGCIAGTNCGDTQRAILLELGGQITSLTSFSGGAFMGVSTIPYGTHHLLHKIAPKAVSTKEAHSKLDVLLKEVSKDEDGDIIFPEQITAPLTEWGGAIVRAAQELTGGVVPPRTIYLMTEDVWYPLYSSYFSRSEAKERYASNVSIAPYVKAETVKDKKIPSGPEDARLRALLQAVDEPASVSE